MQPLDVLDRHWKDFEPVGSKAASLRLECSEFKYSFPVSWDIFQEPASGTSVLKKYLDKAVCSAQIWKKQMLLFCIKCMCVSCDVNKF